MPFLYCKISTFSNDFTKSLIEDEHRHAVHAFISCSWIHNMLIPESITGISCFMFRPKPSQRLPTLHGRALHGFHFHHHVSPGLIPCNYGKNHAVHGTCHGSAWSLCQTQKKVKSWRIIKSSTQLPETCYAHLLSKGWHPHTLHNTTLHYTTLHYTTLHYTTLHYTL